MLSAGGPCKHALCPQMLLAHDLGVQQLNTWPQYRGSISAEDGQARVVVQPQMWFLALLAFSATKEAPAAAGRTLERTQTTTMLRTMSSVKQSVVGRPNVLLPGLSCLVANLLLWGCCKRLSLSPAGSGKPT